MIIYVIIAIVFFGILVGIHEFGHFAVAKLCGIRVEEFAIGMGPAIFQKKKGETLYSLRCIPFGGYCAMTGEDGESEDPRAFVIPTACPGCRPPRSPRRSAPPGAWRKGFP